VVSGQNSKFLLRQVLPELHRKLKFRWNVETTLSSPFTLSPSFSSSSSLLGAASGFCTSIQRNHLEHSLRFVSLFTLLSFFFVDNVTGKINQKN